MYKKKINSFLRNDGVTLLEIIIVIGIAGILLSMAVPSFRSTLINNRLSSENNDLMVDIIFARSEAIRSADTVSICPSTDGISCTLSGWGDGRIIFIDKSTAGFVDNGDVILRVSSPVKIGDSIVATKQSDGSVFTNAFIQYNGNGTTGIIGGLVLTTCNTGFNKHQVVIQSIGRVTASKTVGVCP